MTDANRDRIQAEGKVGQLEGKDTVGDAKDAVSDAIDNLKKDK